MNKKVIFLSLALITTGFAYFSTAYYIPNAKENAFWSDLENEIKTSSSPKIELKNLTKFDWDKVNLLVQLDDSWSEQSIKDFVIAKNYQYSFLDIFYIPRVLDREYEAALIFSLNNEVNHVLRLSSRELKFDDTIYRLNPIIKESKSIYYFEISPKKEASELIKSKLGYSYNSDITLLSPKEN